MNLILKLKLKHKKKIIGRRELHLPWPPGSSEASHAIYMAKEMLIHEYVEVVTEEQETPRDRARSRVRQSRKLEAFEDLLLSPQIWTEEDDQHFNWVADCQDEDDVIDWCLTILTTIKKGTR